MQSNKPKKAIMVAQVNKTKGSNQRKKGKSGVDRALRWYSFDSSKKRDSRKRELRLRLSIYNNV